MLGWGLRFFFKKLFLWNYTIPKVGLGFLEEKKFVQWNTILNVRILGEEYIHAMKSHNKCDNYDYCRGEENIQAMKLHNAKC
jgi:hypothetical protein